MPGHAAHRQSKPMGRLAKHAKEKSHKSVDALFDGDEHKFVARIGANRGSYFQLVYHDGSQATDSLLLGSPCGAFIAGGKKKCKVRVHLSVGDFVVVEGCERVEEAKLRGRPLVVDITGKLSKKEAQQLYRDGRLHATVYKNSSDDAADDLFDYDSEDDVDAESEEDEAEAYSGRRGGGGAASGKSAAAAKKRTVTIKSRQDAAAASSGGGAGGAAANHLLKDQIEANAYADALDEFSEEENKGKSQRPAARPRETAAKPALKTKGVRHVSFAATPSLTSSAYCGDGGEAAGQESMWGEAWQPDPYSAAPAAVVPDNWEDAVDIDAI